MSGTRSPSRKAPATDAVPRIAGKLLMDQIDALIVSHGQPSDPDPAEAALAGLLGRVAERVPELRVGAATMAAPDRLEAELPRLVPGGAVYPLFMSDGWFVRTALAGRLGDAPVQVMQPFGMDAALPGIIAKSLRRELAGGTSPILLVAHGSASGRSAPERATQDFTDALTTLIEGLEIRVAFLEQEPSIQHVAKDMREDAICLPFFAMEGEHVRDDVHEELAAIRFKGQVLPVINAYPGVDKMIASALRAQAGADRKMRPAASV